MIKKGIVIVRYTICVMITLLLKVHACQSCTLKTSRSYKPITQHGYLDLIVIREHCCRQFGNTQFHILALYDTLTFLCNFNTIFKSFIVFDFAYKFESCLHTNNVRVRNSARIWEFILAKILLNKVARIQVDSPNIC